jgi:AcrR family transcriptional regulator
MVIREVGQEPAGRAADMREHILEAAEEILKKAGLDACTTRAIAERAGCAEGSIYRYFQDKHALFIEVVKRRFPMHLQLMTSLPDLAGTGDVRAHLEEVAGASLVFYRGILPMAAGVTANRELLEQQRRAFKQTGTGPALIIRSLAEFVRREQEAGRIKSDPSPEHVARALLGACFMQAYLEFFLGDEAAMGDDAGFAKETVAALFEGLNPARTRKGAYR